MSPGRGRPFPLPFPSSPPSRCGLRVPGGVEGSTAVARRRGRSSLRTPGFTPGLTASSPGPYRPPRWERGVGRCPPVGVLPGVFPSLRAWSFPPPPPHVPLRAGVAVSPLPGVRGPGVLLKSRVSRSPPAPQGGEEGEGHPGTIARRCSPWALFSGSFQVPWAVCVCTGEEK